MSRLRLLGEIVVNTLECMQNRLQLEKQDRLEMLLVEIEDGWPWQKRWNKVTQRGETR